MGDLTAERSDVKPLLKGKSMADEEQFPGALKQVFLLRHKRSVIFVLRAIFNKLAQTKYENPPSTVLLG